MTSPENGDEGPQTYALRLTNRALTDVEAAYVRFAELAGEAVADAWKDGFFEAIAGLALMPHRQVVSESARFQQEVRQILYRRPGSEVAYRVLYVVQDDGPDGPQVVILALRHAARKPITRAEAREMERQE